MQLLKNKILKLVLGTGFLLFMSSPVLAEAVSAEALLAKMTSAKRSLSYKGTFTYEDGGGKVEALEIYHRVENGTEVEVINHLNGPKRTFNLPSRSSGCESVGSRLLMPTGEEFSKNENYVYALRGKNRIAGREVNVLRIIPRDEFRYGLTLGLDAETGLMLLAVVMSPQKLLERIQFTSLAVEGSEILADSADLEGGEECSEVAEGQSPLAPQWVPKGFRLAKYSFSPNTGHVETYTDGLASFSVTVQSRVGASSEALQGEAQRGATVIRLALVAVQNKPVQVSVIGEIPPASANRILRSVRPVSS